MWRHCELQRKKDDTYVPMAQKSFITNGVYCGYYDVAWQKQNRKLGQ